MALAALRKLVALQGDLKDLIVAHSQEQQRMRGISVKAVVPVCRADIDHALLLHQDGLIDSAQLQAWAECLEMNDYVEYEAGAEATIADILFRLSTPSINEQISASLVATFRTALRSPPS